MALSMLRLCGRQGLLQQTSRAIPLMTNSLPITTNQRAIEEMREFWHKNEVQLGRPQSPHLSIYAAQLTSMLSITHRISGIGMGIVVCGFGCVMPLMPHKLPYYMDLISIGPAGIYIAKTILCWPIIYHLINGIRHMSWDLCYGFGLKELYRSGYFVFTLSWIVAALTATL
ncbi:succinate dehydrogenase cytochrome b560 subunit, mitochondrial-like [Tubulanus polymorphus]|uniref:succinate dehydrogenase cytochrome b560 subunit, mitochondrial-like n=1 Tax=Tubulanus polymorphus TaxID=672921 RepID=UPI003DA3AFBF